MCAWKWMYSNVSMVYVLQTQYVMSSLGLKMVNRKINKLFQKHTHFWMFPPATEITRYDWHILKPGKFPCSKNATCCLWEPVRIPLVIASYPLGPTMSRTGANQNFWGKSKEARKGWRATAQSWKLVTRCYLWVFTLGDFDIEIAWNSPIFWRRQKRFEVRL